MKKATLKSLIAIVLAGVLCFGLVACGPRTPHGGDGGGSEIPTDQVTITIGDAPSTISKGTTVQLTVTVTGTENKAYTWSMDREGILEISSSDVVSVKADAVISTDTVVTLTATATADTTKTASVAFIVTPAIEGQVGSLTADVIKEIAGYNITFEGTVTDIYIDTNNSMNSSETAYHSVVMMDGDEDGGSAWYGSFYQEVTGASADVHPIETNYRRGDVVDGGHQLKTVFIDRHNEVTEQAEMDVFSEPYLWESNHLWNHVRGLGADITHKFTYDASHDYYIYHPDFTDIPAEDEYSADAWLLTYLAYSLTPMLEDTFATLSLRIAEGEDGKMHVTEITATTIAETSTDQNDNILTQAYTKVTLAPKNIGTTEVPDPKPYAKPELADKLDDAIETMKTAKNYRFTTVEHDMYIASGSDDDYDMSSTTTTPNTASPVADTVTGYGSHTASSGTPGVVGYVTKDIILFEETGQYPAYESGGNPYYVEYSGYRQYANGDNPYYEEFDSNPTFKEAGWKYLTGTKRVYGDMFEKAMPQWDFSSALFDYRGSSRRQIGGTWTKVHEFRLRETAITAEIAMQISAHSFADSAIQAQYSTLTIWVDDAGNLVETEFPFDITMAGGYLTTTFDRFGTTELDSAKFGPDFYKERVWRTDWSDYIMRFYDRDHTTRVDDITSDKAIDEFWGAGAVNKLPKPEIFMEVFGDNTNGPFYESYTIRDNSDTTIDEDDRPILEYVDYFRMNTEATREYYADNLDRNGNMVNPEQVFGKDSKIAEKLTAAGYTYSAVNSGLRYGSYYATYTGKGFMVVLSTNYTRWIDIDIYKTGDWSLAGGRRNVANT